MKKVLSIGAHPDDIEIGCGGTELVLRKRGYSLVHVVATFGEEGSLEPGVANRRKLEAEASARVLGAERVYFLGLEDGLTAYGKRHRVELIRILRTERPDIVFIHASGDKFPDHRIVRDLSESAINAAGGPWYPEAGGEPHAVPQVYGFEVWNTHSQPACIVDISEVIEEKMAALRCHASQIAGVDYLSVIRGLAQYRGATAMKGAYAEAFEVVRTPMAGLAVTKA